MVVRGRLSVVACALGLALTVGTTAPVTAAVAEDDGPAVIRTVPLPGGGTTVFGHRRFLTAYYGTAGTGVLGVLGETDPDAAFGRIVAAGKAFRRPGERVLPVFELIVTVADGIPGSDGDYSHDIAHSLVQPYIDAAHRHGALLLLDLQPGRTDFRTVAKRWQWALEDPYVGLALDPEWRMGPREVPAQTIGGVSAREVNRHLGLAGPAHGRRPAPREALRRAPVQVVDGGGHRPRAQARRPGDGAARRRLRHPVTEARDVRRGRPARGSSRWASSCSTTRTGRG